MKYLTALALPLLGWGAPASAEKCPATHRTNHGSTQCSTEKISDAALADEPGIIVVNGGLPEPMGEAAYSITSVDLSINASKRVENALLQVPGLQQFRRADARSANPTSQGITMRGLGGNASSRVLFILDGVPQSDPFGGWVAWPGYDAINLASVRVRAGGGAGSDGPGALAGTIHAESDISDRKTSISAFYGSRDSLDAKASLARKLGAGNLTVSGSYVRGDGFIPIVEGQRGAVDRAAPFEQGGIALRFVSPLTGTTELQAGVRAFTDARDRGFDYSDSENSGVDASFRLVNRTGGGSQWSALAYIQIRDFASQFGSITAGRTTVLPVLDQYSTPSSGLGALFELRPSIGEDAELRIGGDWRRTWGETNEKFFFSGPVPGRSRRAGGETNIMGAFVDGSWTPVEGIIFTGGGRFDHWQISNGFRKEVNIGGPNRSDENFTDRSGWESSGRAAIVVEVIEGLSMRSAAYLGWRLPTLNELYRPFRVGPDATAANEMLVPERLKGAEIGIDVSGRGLSLNATAFINRLNNAIANVALGQGPATFPGVGFVAAGGTYRQRQNLDALDSKGIEVDASYKSGDFTIRAGYAYIDAVVISKTTGAGLDGLRPAQVPSHFGSLGLTYDTKPVRLYLNTRYVAAQFEDDANMRRLGSMLSVDASISYKLTEQIQFELRGENLFDNRIEAAISSDGTIERSGPRVIWAGTNIEF
ncbi:MAG: TonB-dependent receptor [Sphingorhabdus sp.]